MLLMCIASLGANAQRANRLIIDDIVVEPGSTAQLPVAVSNTDAVVGMEFDLTLPDGVTMDLTATPTDRVDDHQTTIRNMGGNTYKVLLYSPSNKPLHGSSGAVMKLPLHIPYDIADGAEYPLTLENAVLAIVSGANVLTSVSAGKIIVSTLPDLTVRNIAADKSTFNPGEHISISWEVRNIGQASTGDGWSEQVSLVSEDGSESKLIATEYYRESLGGTSGVNRSTEVDLPALLGIDGPVKIQVRIVPFEGVKERSDAVANNTGQSESVYTVGKQLTLEVSPTRFVENEASSVYVRLNRSGRWTEEQSFGITATADSRIDIPNAITIPAGQSGAVIYLPIADNTILDNDSIVDLSISGNGYAAVSQRIIIEDNEYPDLSVTASKSVVNEGETFQLTVTTSRVSGQSVVVTLTSENNERFSFPSQVTIPANEESVTIDVTATENEIPDVDLSNMFTAVAPRHNTGEALILLQDNDMPVLQLSISPDKVSESAGPVSISGVLRRLTNQDKKITVKLSDNSNGSIYYANSTIEMASGVDEIHFNLGPIDNANVDGDRIYTITAAVYVSSCSCSASGESAGAVNTQLEVYDNDGPTLSLASSASTVREGGTVSLTVTRNTSTAADLIVNLSSDNDGILTYNHSVTIPAGANSTSTEVTIASNDVQNDSKIIVFTAEADGMSAGTCYLNVTDQTKPDAYISNITASKESETVKGHVTLSIDVANKGLDVLPRDVAVKVYLKGVNNALTMAYTEKQLAVGETETVKIPVALPSNVGTHRYYAVVNENSAIDELSFNNNTSAEVSVLATAPYTATVSTDKTIYNQGDKVLVTGQLNGNGIANTAVEVYVINDGARQTQTVETDAQGAFSSEWQLYSLQSGHFIAGACFPGEGLTEAMASFDVYGLRRTSGGYVTCDVTMGDTYNGNIGYVNPGVLDLTDVKVEVLSKPDNCEVTVDIPTTINGGETVQLTYSLTGTAATDGNDWDEINLRITTAEGVTLDQTLYFYCRNARAKLVASVDELVTTMTKGKSREYSIQVTNIGKGNSGKVVLALVPWMKSLSGNELPSMNQNDTTTIALQFTPTDDMQLNVPQTGQFAINCENGEGTVVKFNITPVAEEKGTLTVDVMDEYTYYTDLAPHVEGAQVVVRNPVTKALVAQGLTGPDGKLSVELTEGYYSLSVTANNHDSYSNNIYVDPGTETFKEINLSVQGITVDWRVEETEVEDEYEIVTTVTFETNVPEPIVVLEVPSRIEGENLNEGESLVFYAKLTNKGLINAEDAEVVFQERTGDFVWEPLAQNQGLTIAPQQSIVIPIKVTRLHHSSVNRRASSEDGCVQDFIDSYKWVCGKDRKWHEYTVRVPYLRCPIKPGSGGPTGPSGPWVGPRGPYGPTGPNGPNIGPGIPWYNPNTNNNNVTTKDETNNCIPCVDHYSKKLVDCGISFILPSALGCAKGGIDCGKSSIEGDTDWRFYADCTLSGVGCIAALCESSTAVTGVGIPVAAICEGIGTLADVASCVISLTEPCDPESLYNRAKRAASEPSYITQLRNAAMTTSKEYCSYLDIIIELFGDSAWVTNTTLGEMEAILDEVAFTNNKYLVADDYLLYKPMGISLTQYYQFIERLNNTTTFDLTGQDSENRIHYENIKNAYSKMEEAEKEAIEMGYNSVGEMWGVELNRCYEKLQEGKSTVCASITLQFTQNMVMTRQAFRGTLTIFNGHETEAMTDVKLTLNVSSADGKVATSHEFQINPETLNGFNGELDLTSGWSLAAGGTGIATIIFIPTKYAAPTGPVDYSFGGTLSYIDPFSGLEVTRELYPVTLTVKPSPELDLDYFLQRDVYGDDPLTEDVVEPMEPAEFALLINNKGYGDATNVRMTTQQPEIIDNEKGLLIDFEILSSQVNGEEKTLAFGESIANDFGTIEAGTQTYAQWWLQSSLLGHFTDYSVSYNHLTSYGNEDLSLLDEVRIHELIHGFTAADGKRGFLVNDIADADDLPDKVYLTDGTDDMVGMAAAATLTPQGDDYLLSVSPSEAGWTYGTLIDPTDGKQELTAVIRQSDGVEIPLDNVWRTDRTLRDGKDPLYENRIHFVGNLPANGETYLLSFTPREQTEPNNTVNGIITAQTADGEPVVGATVTLRSGDVTYTTTTNSSGQFTMQVDDTSKDYVISCTAEGFIDSQEQSVSFGDEATNCFFVLQPGATVYMSASGLCTYSSVVGLDFTQASAPVKAYYGKVYNTQRVILNKVEVAAAGEGLVLQGDAGSRIDIPAAYGATLLTDNLLTGTAFEPFTVTTDDVYVLANLTGKPKFHQAERGLVIPRFKAYLLYYLDEDENNSLEIIFDETLLIDMIRQAEQDTDHFRADGVKIDLKQKGLHILKGKKIMVK